MPRLITSEPRVSFVELTPKLAAEALQLNTANRQLAPGVVAVYADEITDEMWCDGVADVAVSRDGVLINGQHICHAVLRTGMPVVVALKTGMHPDAFHAYDSQRNRTGAQVLRPLSTIRNTGATAAIIRRVDMVKQGKPNTKMRNTRISAIFNEDPAMWQRLAVDSDSVRHQARPSGLLLSAAAIGAFLWSVQQVDDYQAGLGFARSVAAIEGHRHGLPATTLRRWMTTHHRGGSAPQLPEHSAWVRAWNAHAEGRDLTVIRNVEEISPTLPRTKKVAA